MLRVYFMQQWFNFSDPQAEDSLYDIEPMRRFAGIELAEEVIPDETTILRFHHLLEEHRLTEVIFAEVRELLEERGLLLTSGTIVDATIINAPSSTKNATEERDPEMHQTRKGKQWYFGMKVHVGATKQGLVHTLATGPANEADITRLDDLLHGQEEELYGDQAYWSEEHRLQCKYAGIRYRVNRRAKPGEPLTEHEKLINRSRSRRRARGEFAFHVVKRLWGFAKTRYRGIYKKHRARVEHVCAGESVHGAAAFVAARGEVRPVKAKMRNLSAEMAKKRAAKQRLGAFRPWERA
jgi:transposase, IS5 family